MKKILLILICIQLIGLPVLADYDFSDEAQAEFDRQQKILLHPQQDLSEKKRAKEIKTGNDVLYPLEEYLVPIDERNSYEPIIDQKTMFYGRVVEIPKGTVLSVTFDSGINSNSLDKADRLTVRLTNDLIYNGILVAPSGSLVYGTVTDATSAGYAYGSGDIELSFDYILTPEGNRLNISTEKIVLKAKSERAVKMTRDVVLGALGSMLVGAAFTALGGGDNWGRNMAVYGGLGALGGGVRGAMQRGEDVQIPDGTTIQVKLIQPLKVSGI